MQKIKKHIEIVRASKSSLSSMSIGSALALREALAQVYTKVGITNISTQSDLDLLALFKPDLVFLGMKQLPTNHGTIWLADFLDDLDIPYTGSAKSAHELEINKSKAKKRAMHVGLKTSAFFVAVQGTQVVEEDIPFSYPVFIKPTDRGGGVGIDDKSVARNFDQLKSKVESISLGNNADSLIEMFLDGREFSIAILREAGSDEFMVMPLELIAPPNSQGDRLLSSAIKSADTEEFMAVEHGSLRNAVMELALHVFHALGARDYGRIDIRLDGAGVPHFLEANLMPSILKDYGNFPKACMLNETIGYEESILRIVDLAFERSADTQQVSLVRPAILAA